MTGKRSVITNLIFNSEMKDTINSPSVFAELFNKKIVNFATTVGGPNTQEFEECIKNIDKDDDKMFAFPTNITEIFKRVGYLKNNKAVGTDAVSSEVLQTLLRLNIFFLIGLLDLPLAHGCFPKCLEDAKAYTLHMSADILNINNYRSISILPSISEMFEKTMYERLCSSFDKKNMFHSKQFGFRSKRSTVDALDEITERKYARKSRYIHMYTARFAESI